MTNASNDDGQAARRLWQTGTILVALLLATLGLALCFASPELRSLAVVWAVFAALPPALIASWFQGVRLARLAGPPATSWQGVQANALSACVFLVVPGRVSEAVKPAVLRLHTGLQLVSGFTALTLERLLDIGCLSVLTTLAGLTAAGSYASDLTHAAQFMTGLLATGIAMLLLLTLLPGFALRAISRLPGAWLRRTAENVLAAMKRGGSLAVMLPATGHSIVIWGGAFLSTYAVIVTLGSIPLLPSQALFVFVAGTLGFIITVTPGGLGTFEAATVLAMGSFGYPIADALTIAVLVRIVNLIPALIGTVWLIAKGGFRLADLIGRRPAAGGPT